ncbi:hypothetical protein HAX54_051655 [Datura stramonium]|uniref:Protein kinase domain-containing protein n=1 Tax=Datura stramonium TaxID=4076 RepID=A0ABS8SYN3_DATST|nr:hypothetical protein [Datura stramonium]
MILLFIIQYYSVSVSSDSSNETDQEVLLAFQKLVTSPSHFLANSWTKNTVFCSWFGITCSSKRQRVVALSLPDLQLQDTISPSLANLSFLRELNLENNFFHGGFSYRIGHLPHFQVINVQNNQLEGSIPTSLFQYWRVQVISLVFNKLNDEMWKGPWYVSELRVLNLKNNSLTGIIPPSVENATNLLNFSLSGNRINDNILKEIALFNISSLLAASLTINSLSDPLLLDEWNVVSNLKYLTISKKKISGRIPSNICLVRTELKDLFLDFNNIPGEIPRNIGCLVKLEKFYIGRNAISGTIPNSFSNISTLQYLSCSRNQIEGHIPPELGEVIKFEAVSFGEYLSYRRIPTTTGLHLSNIKGLYLADNDLEGEIPLHITNASKIVTLMLAKNFFSGNILTNLGNLCKLMLQDLKVGSNPLNDFLLNSIGNLSSTIEVFDIGDAHINGLIPTSISNMTGLTTLVFQYNNFTGSISPEIECIGNLSMLQHLYFGSNEVAEKFPSSLWKMRGLLFLKVSQNSIKGEVSLDIGGLKAIIDLDLSGNHLSGMRQSRIGDLQNMQCIFLSNNAFSGPIPLFFSNLISLEYLDLYLNALSATIPKSLEKLLYLKAINVSFNNLEGEIPSDGVFVNSTLQLFLGNKGLCGIHKLEVSACAITSLGKQSKYKKLVLKIVTPVVISSFMILLLVSIWIMKRQKKGKSKDVQKIPEIMTYQSISYHEIQQATNIFDGSNLIGKGSSGSVYIVTLSSGTVVVIKVLDLENEQVCRRFDTECEVMKNVRHINLVPVITTCSSDYIRAFVLQFVPNGSPENWLNKENCHLNLLQRVTIMLDVAMEIEYLHLGNDTPIVHCDLNPTKILLDENMVAHVGDFGTSKILAVSRSMTHTETLGTLGYVAPGFGEKRPMDKAIFNEYLGLREWIRQAFQGTMMDVVDVNLFSAEEQVTSRSEICISSVIELALDCTEDTP